MAKTRATGPATNASPKHQMAKPKNGKKDTSNCKAKTPGEKKATSGSKTKGLRSKQSSVGKSLIEKKVKKVFMCPVCLTLPLGSIYQCKEGHLVCMDCYKKFRSPILCPTCRTAMPNDPIRNRAAEQVNSHRYI